MSMEYLTCQEIDVQKSLPKEIPHLQTKNSQVIDLPLGKM